MKVNKPLSINLAIFSMVVAVAASNYLVEIPINSWLTWGALTYPVTFLINEITNANHGPAKARKVVYAGFIIACCLCFLWMNRQIAAASCLAFLISQILDISVFSHLRQRSWWVAPVCASLLASFIDTFIFFSLAFYGQGWLKLALGDLAVKVSIDVLLLLPFRILLRQSSIIPATLGLSKPN